MLDIILKSRSYDLGYVANWGSMFSNYVTNARKGSADFASVWDKVGEAAQTRMEKDIDAYANADS
jgi:hypothetical protein